MTNAPHRRSMRDARNNIGRIVDIAHHRNEPTIIERYGEPRAVIVSYDWWAARQEDSTTEKTVN